MNELQTRTEKRFDDAVGWIITEIPSNGNLPPVITPSLPATLPADPALTFDAAVKFIESQGFHCLPWEALTEEQQNLVAPSNPTTIKEALIRVSAAESIETLHQLLDGETRTKVLAAAEKRAAFLTEQYTI